MGIPKYSDERVLGYTPILRVGYTPILRVKKVRAVLLGAASLE